MAASVTMRANISELDAMLNDLNEGTYSKSMHTGHTLQANDYFSDFEENTSYSALPTNYSAHDGNSRRICRKFFIILNLLLIDTIDKLIK